MDRNKFISNVCPPVGRSLSARRAWIEIISVRGHGFWPRVALRKESVDRNLAGGHFIDLGQKSLSARRAWIEIISVRGHGFWPRWSLSARRAWIEIVDVVSVQHGCESLSARRAWIEIDHPFHRVGNIPVALRKESVDRNKFISNVCPPVGRSLSARRAWIEIHIPHSAGPWQGVALRKESVDRNTRMAG